MLFNSFRGKFQKGIVEDGIPVEKGLPLTNCIGEDQSLPTCEMRQMLGAVKVEPLAISK